MPALALDIGTYSIKAIGANTGKSPTVLRAVEVFNSTGVALPTDEAQVEAMGKLIGDLINDNKLPKNDVRLSLPESAVSSKLISLPALSDAELASAIMWQAEQHIPIPKEELSLQYRVLYRPTKKDKQEMMRVMLVGARKSTIQYYTNVLLNIGIEPLVLETQMLSVLRGLQISPEDPPTMIVNFGASEMDMSMINQSEIQFVISYPGGGQLLNKALQQNIGLDEQQAEQYKRSYGLDAQQFEGKIRAALLPTAQAFINEIKKAADYYTSQNPQLPLKRIILTGGSSQLPGLVEFITQSLNVEVLQAMPFANAKGEIPTQNQAVYQVCMGLLTRED